MIGEEISVSKAAIAAIALAAWRLHRKYIVSSGLDHKVPLTFGLQKIIRELKSAGIEFVEFDNVPYDGGLAVQVLHTVQDESGRRGQLIVAETVEPMVLWNDQMIHEGKVILTRSVLKGKERKTCE